MALRLVADVDIIFLDLFGGIVVRTFGDGARPIGADADVGFALSGGGDGAGAGRGQGGTGHLQQIGKSATLTAGGRLGW